EMEGDHRPACRHPLGGAYADRCLAHLQPGGIIWRRTNAASGWSSLIYPGIRRSEASAACQGQPCPARDLPGAGIAAKWRRREISSQIRPGEMDKGAARVLPGVRFLKRAHA